MSRTKHATKGPGFDFMSRRPTKSASGHPGYVAGYGPEVKRRTHRAERRQAKASTRNTD